MSILDHPDYESCIKPWCTAVAAGKEPPQVEFGDAQHIWTLVEVPVWYNERRYRLVPRKIMIGKREVNAPVGFGNGKFKLCISSRANPYTRTWYFTTEEDAAAAHSAIDALLKSDDTTEPTK